jgi:hypothetical protein
MKHDSPSSPKRVIRGSSSPVGFSSLLSDDLNFATYSSGFGDHVGSDIMGKVRL